MNSLDSLLDGFTLFLILYGSFMFWIFDGFNMLMFILDFVWTRVL